MAVRRNRLGAGNTLRTICVGVAVACLTAGLAACGGGDDEAAPAAQNNPPPGGNPPASNTAPTISGTPPAQAMQNQVYTFEPTASDANGDALMFAVTNKPAWATFTTSNGRLTGTPTSVATHSNIGISVSDGTATTNLTSFSITVVGTTTGSAMLSWTPPTQNTDGSPLNNLSGYRVYWGTSQTNLSNSVTLSNPGLSSYVVSQLTPATWYFALTAVNSAGAESTQSNVASKQVM